VGEAPFPLKFALKVTHPLSNTTIATNVHSCGTKRHFAAFASKIQLLSKEVRCKVSFCETTSGKVVATSFFYLTVHRWIAGDVPIYLKFALKVTHPFIKRRFRQILLNSATAVRGSEKSSIISECELTSTFAICYRPSVRLSVCNVRAPYSAGFEIFGNFSPPFGTLVIQWHSLKILRSSSQRNSPVGGFKSKRDSQI